MIIQVKPHKVIINKDYEINEKEINISKCYFEFSEEITNDYVKEALFTYKDKAYKQIIANNECDIPNEILEIKGEVELGVVAYLVEDETEIKRYNPTPDYFNTLKGSFKDAENSVPITPSEMEQFEQILQEGLNEVETALEQVENVDIDAEQTETGASVTITNRNGEQKTVEVLNGEKGEKGDTGEQGLPGKDGKDGQDGQDGYTPIKGIDYFTQEDITSLGIPRKTSDLQNDSGFIDNSVNNLTNYYDKTSVYTKNEIDAKISSVYKYKGSVPTYSDLPSVDLTIGDVYNVESDGSNYAWNGTIWDKLGGEVDLSNYYNKTQTDTLLSGKVDTSTLNDYYTKTRTDELLGTKVDTTTLQDYVKNTDYATSSTGGVIRIGSSYGTSVSSTGYLAGSARTYEQYSSAGDGLIVGKGTLENVITGKDLTTKSYVDGLVGDINTALDTINGEVI